MSEPTIILRSLELSKPKTGKDILGALEKLVEEGNYRKHYCNLARDYDCMQSFRIGLNSFYTAYDVAVRTAQTSSEWQLASGDLPGNDEVILSEKYAHIALVTRVTGEEDIRTAQTNLEWVRNLLSKKLNV